MLATVLAVAQHKCCYNIAPMWPWTRYKQIATTTWIEPDGMLFFRRKDARHEAGAQRTASTTWMWMAA
eukprot:4056369-Lingulodinium_polyedra.AAC.1